MDKYSDHIPKEIQQLLDKYYNGLSTLQEERELKAFFKEHNSSPEGKIFDFPNTNNEEPIDHQRILNEINNRERIKKNQVKKLIYISSIAATLFIVLTLGMLVINDRIINNHQLADTYSSPEEAYKMAQKYFNLVSRKLNYGYTEIKPIGKIALPINAINNITALEKGYNSLSRIGEIAEQSESLKYVSVFNEYINVE